MLAVHGRSGKCIIARPNCFRIFTLRANADERLRTMARRFVDAYERAHARLSNINAHKIPTKRISMELHEIVMCLFLVAATGINYIDNVRLFVQAETFCPDRRAERPTHAIARSGAAGEASTAGSLVLECVCDHNQHIANEDDVYGLLIESRRYVAGEAKPVTIIHATRCPMHGRYFI